MTEKDFRARLEILGLRLDARAFARAWAGAQHLSESAARVAAWLAATDD